MRTGMPMTTAQKKYISVLLFFFIPAGHQGFIFSALNFVHRKRLNASPCMEAKKYCATLRVSLFCSSHILTSSVIYY